MTAAPRRYEHDVDSDKFVGYVGDYDLYSRRRATAGQMRLVLRLWDWGGDDDAKVLVFTIAGEGALWSIVSIDIATNIPLSARTHLALRAIEQYVLSLTPTDNNGTGDALARLQGAKEGR